MPKGLSITWLLFCIVLSTIPIFEVLGKTLFWCSSLGYIIFHCLNNKNIFHKHLPLFWIWGLFIWMLVRAQNFDGLYYVVMIGLLLLGYSIKIPFSPLKKFWVFAAFGVISFFGCSLFFINSEFYTNANVGGLVCLLFTVLIYKLLPHFRLYAIAIGAVALLGFDSRSVLLSLVGALVIVFLTLRLKLKLGKVLLFGVIIMTSVIAYYWDVLWSTGFDQTVFQMTGKHFQSGRNSIWMGVYDAMDGVDWLIGKGGGTSHRPFVPIHFENLSLHSSYVFMIFHYGFIGLFLLWGLLYKVLQGLNKNKYYYSLVMVLFFIIRDFFEITLIHNLMVVAFIFWAWLAHGWLDRLKFQETTHTLPRQLK